MLCDGKLPWDTYAPLVLKGKFYGISKIEVAKKKNYKLHLYTFGFSIFVDFYCHK